MKCTIIPGGRGSQHRIMITGDSGQTVIEVNEVHVRVGMQTALYGRDEMELGEILYRLAYIAEIEKIFAVVGDLTEEYKRVMGFI